MQLMIDHLPIVYKGHGEGYLHTLRHWLIHPSGRIFFQDEKLLVENGEMTPQGRTAWEELPTPPMTWDVVGIVDHGGLPMAMMQNGQAFIYASEVGSAAPPRWVPFADAVPGSHSAGLEHPLDFSGFMS